MPPHKNRLAGRRILVVEDEYLIASELEHWLQDEGATVVGPVPSVDQAMDCIEAEDALDAAVLDINLGRDKTASPIADRLNAAGIPFLFATGEIRVSDSPNYRDRPWLFKPLLKVEFLDTLEKLFGNRQA